MLSGVDAVELDMTEAGCKKFSLKGCKVGGLKNIKVVTD